MLIVRVAEGDVGADDLAQIVDAECYVVYATQMSVGIVRYKLHRTIW